MRNCSVDRTLTILSDAWSFLVLREVYLGARRFDQVQAVLHMPRSTLSARLAQLVKAKVLSRVPLAGSARFEYRLTERGFDLYLVMLAMLRFGDDWLAGDKPPPLRLVHTTCGHECHPETICSACREPVNALRVVYRDGPGAGVSHATAMPQRRRSGGVETFERGRPSSVSRTLGILADRWTFLVVREMCFGVRRFDVLQERLGIATNILTDRLNRLVSQGILRRVKYLDVPERYEYKLTTAGRDLYLPLIQMLRWGDKWLGYEKPLILKHLDCGHDFEPIVACDHCRQALDPHDMRYHLTYSKLREDHPPALLAADDDQTGPA
ncbi:MAG: helix-turn-helix transcriptional regulator [Afipia sp.]|nr:helix-turn-helix transcriptional regulator [Afipia sp.]